MKWDEKTILFIGASGSFGTNFLKLLVDRYKPKTIRIYSRDEHKQTQLLNNYGGVGKKNNLSGFIGDIRDKDRLKRAMDGVDIVIHAAALKQVQSCEYNPFEAIKTNVIGSMNIVDCAIDCGVEKVLAISTDKAVSPLNLYGATKMCMEKLIINANNYRGSNKTKFCCTRYGNVVASRGTIVPIWREMLYRGETIPITNVKATRFWIGMREANQFVADCIEMMDTLDGGETFIPEIPSVNVLDVYRAMAGNHATFSVIGDRVGDKLHETLISKEEIRHTVKIGDKYVIYPEEPLWKYSKPQGDYCAYGEGYSSDANKKQLSVEEIKRTLEENK